MALFEFVVIICMIYGMIFIDERRAREVRAITQLWADEVSRNKVLLHVMDKRRVGPLICTPFKAGTKLWKPPLPQLSELPHGETDPDKAMCQDCC